MVGRGFRLDIFMLLEGKMRGWMAVIGLLQLSSMTVWTL